MVATARLTRPGFTLIELIAVIAVVAVLAAAAVPSLSAMTDRRAAAAARLLLRDVSQARQRAVATGTPTWVVFDTTAETWSVLVEDPSNLGRVNATALTDLATGAPRETVLGTGAFAGVELTTADFDGNPEVGFDWLGRPLNAAETALAAAGSVQISGGHTVSVAVTTGYTTHAGP
jgi:prepilin-type N-terminal cleavage/methylation domain-containing protein